MMSHMKQTSLEPGVVQIVRLFAIVGSLLLPFLWYNLAPMIGAETAFNQYAVIGTPVLLFVVIYTTFPWWKRRMGRAFLPAALILLGAQSILGNYFALTWFVPAGFREIATLALLPRLWFNHQFLVLVVAWQYNMFWTMVIGIGLSLLDTALVFPFIDAGGGLYPFFVTLVIARLLTVTGVGLCFAWLIQRQREQKAALAEMNEKLVQYAATSEQLAVSQERIRLARELHDTLAHSLSSITVQLEAAESIWGVDMPKAHALMGGALNNTRTGLAEARRALQALRAGALEEVGLQVAVGELAHSAAARGNLSLELKLLDELPILTLAEEQCLYRVAQEALSNVTRHARATRVCVELRPASDQLLLIIADDGKGFDPALVKGGHFGLKGLRERADLIGATLEIVSQPQRGTTVTLYMPVGEIKA